RIHVVAADVDRPANLAHAKHRAQGHHVSLRVSYLQQLDLAWIVAKRSAALSNYLPGAAEKVEVVDIIRAEIDLERIEDIFGIDAHGLTLIAIKIDEQLRHIGAKDAEQMADHLTILGIIQGQFLGR